MARKSLNESHQFVEGLEDRLLFNHVHATQVTADYLDNRGQAMFNVSIGLDLSTLSRKTAAIYTAGADSILGTADDVRNYTAVGYRKGRLSLRATLPLNTAYRVILNASVIKDINGRFLDGEFNGDLKSSGDGIGGGNYDVISQNAAKTRARFSTAAGFINVGLYRNTPITKSNFVTYVNAADYDSSVFHRAQKKSENQGIDIVQGGGFKLDVANNTTVDITTRGNINNEGTNPNLMGTLAMANANQVGGPKNTNNSQWFFNVTDDPLLDTNPGDFTVFGAVLDVESQNTLNALLAFPKTTGTQTYPLAAGQGSDVPYRSLAAIQARNGGAGGLSPKDDLLTVDRIAMLMDVVATPGGAQRALARPASAPAPLANAALAPLVSPFLTIKDQKNPLLD